MLLFRFLCFRYLARGLQSMKCILNAPDITVKECIELKLIYSTHLMDMHLPISDIFTRLKMYGFTYEYLVTGDIAIAIFKKVEEAYYETEDPVERDLFTKKMKIFLRLNLTTELLNLPDDTKGQVTVMYTRAPGAISYLCLSCPKLECEGCYKMGYEKPSQSSGVAKHDAYLNHVCRLCKTNQKITSHRCREQNAGSNCENKPCKYQYKEEIKAIYGINVEEDEFEVHPAFM